jgi:hypothetical protein
MIEFFLKKDQLIKKDKKLFKSTDQTCDLSHQTMIIS